MQPCLLFSAADLLLLIGSGELGVLLLRITATRSKLIPQQYGSSVSESPSVQSLSIPTVGVLTEVLSLLTEALGEFLQAPLAGREAARSPCYNTIQYNTIY